MPYPNFHSCRLEDPKKYDTCRTGERIADKPKSVKGKKYTVIYCKKGDGPMEQQAFRYPIKTWTKSQAKSHCDYNEGSFEAAKKEKKSIDKQIELRSYPSELRVDDSGDKPKIHGYAAVFNKLSEDLGGFREKIKRGAFAKTIKESDIVATRNHNNDLLLGRNKSGTLILEEDKKGLKMEIDPPDTTYAKDLIISMKRGDINQCSFKFRVHALGDEWDNKDKNNIIRTLKEVELFDVTIATDPAYPQTKAQYRSTKEVYKDFLKSQKEKEKLDDKIDKKKDYKIALRKKQLELIGKI